MFIPYNGRALPAWLSSTLALINSAIDSCPLFYQGTIWIPKDFYPDNLRETVSTILSSIVSGWTYTSDCYNAATFGDAVAASRIGIKIFRDIDTDYSIAKRYTNNNYIVISPSYEQCIDTTLNTPVDMYSLPLPPDILLPNPDVCLPPSTLPLQVASTSTRNDWELASPILHPLYPGIEPLPPGQVSGVHSVFGRRFGVPFLDIDGSMYGRPLSGAELLSCYPIPVHIHPASTTWPRLDAILDALLPGCLPFRMVDCIASSASRLDRVYDTQLLADDDMNHGARCFLHGKAPTQILDWQAGYAADADTARMFTALRLSRGKSIPDSDITAVAMGYRQHLQQVNIGANQ